MRVVNGIGAGVVLLALVAAQPAPAQVRDLDSAQADGHVYLGSYAASGEPAAFLLTLRADQAVEIEAAPVDGSDPMLRVTETESGRLIAENDDFGGTLAARVRLHSPTDLRLRIEVSEVGEAEEGAPGRYRLSVIQSDYRPNPVRDIAQGQRHAGTLGAGDEQLFRIRARAAGETWEFSLTAPEGSELDPYLEIFAGEGTLGQSLGSDDDGGMGLNSRLRFVAPAPGTFTVRASGIGSTSGAYAFSASAAAPPRPVETREIALGRPVRDTLSGEPSQQFYRLSDAARTAIARGRPALLVIEMISPDGDALDPLVEVGFETPLGFSAIASDDDGGEGLDARLTLDLSQLSGEPDWLRRLRIRAAGFLDGEGEYELTVSTEPR